MRRIIRHTTLALACLALAATAAIANGLGTPQTKEERNRAMDFVFMNLESISLGTETFTLENGRSPESLDELVETGHLARRPVNPYTGEPIKGILDWRKGQAGDLLVRPSPREKISTEIGAYYALLENKVKYLARREKVNDSLRLKNWLYRDSLDDKERLVSIYSFQIALAMEPFYARHGHYPETLAQIAELKHFDADFTNPFTGERIAETDEFSPGNISYEMRMVTVKLQPPNFRSSMEGLPETEDVWYYRLTAHGSEGPIFYYSNDPDRLPPNAADGTSLQNTYLVSDEE